MTPRFSGHFSIFGFLFFVLLGIVRLWSCEKIAILTLKLRSHVRILLYRTWTIVKIVSPIFLLYAFLTIRIHMVPVSISRRTIISPKRNWRQCLCKRLKRKQTVLRYFWKGLLDVSSWRHNNSGYICDCIW